MKTQIRISVIAAAVAVLTLPLQLSAMEKEAEQQWKGSIAAEKHVTPVEMLALAKTSLEQAIQTALSNTPGKPVKAELEAEDGFLIYGIEIVTADGTVKEVIIDPADGKVLAVELEEAHDKGEKKDKEDKDDDDDKDEKDEDKDEN